MGKMKFTVMGIAVGVIVALSVLLIPPVTIAEECYTVRIYGEVAQSGVGSLRLEPNMVAAKQGDCIVWVNLARAAEVRINFREGKACQGATEAGSGFKLDKACFVTDYLGHAKTSSLVFKDKGTYNYDVEWKEQKIKQSGSVVVE
jgi:hypothetical protein